MISAVVSRYPLSCNSNALTRRPRMLVMTRKNEHEREFAPPQQQNLCENNGLAADTRYCCQGSGTRAPVLEAFPRRFTLTVRETVQRCASLCVGGAHAYPQGPYQMNRVLSALVLLSGVA